MKMRAFAGTALGLCALGAMTGCAGFFVANTSSTVATSTSADYVYVVNQATNTLGEFTLASSALTAVSGSPVSLSSVIASGTATSVVVTRQNSFVYVGGQGGIACFSIGTGGALTSVSAGNIVSTGDIVAMDTSYDGQWLLALSEISTVPTINVYSINTSTGALTVAAGSPVTVPALINGNTSNPLAVRVSPSNAFVAIALGPAGDIVYPFTTSTGLLGSGQEIQFTSGNTSVNDNALAWDITSGYLYIARGVAGAGNSLIESYSVASNGAPTAVSHATTGDAPYGVLAESTGKYVYTANRGTGNVSGFAISAGTFTAIAGSPYQSGTLATALIEDNTNKYVIGAAYGGSNDYTVYSFDALTGGKLDAVAVGLSGTDPAESVAVAATH